ncbi:MAG: hypothetical protein II359_03470, partial [Clostridia bacterium]|nr:hypothetical protein [Clostridia bacterium]
SHCPVNTIVEILTSFVILSKNTPPIVSTISNSKSQITFARNAGCHIYTEKPAVVYANKKFIFMHTAEESTYQVSVPENKRLFDVWNEKEVTESIFCRKGESFLWELEDKK